MTECKGTLISTEILKSLQEDMCGWGEFRVEEPWCDKNPAPICLDDYSPVLDFLLPDWLESLGVNRQVELRFSREIGGLCEKIGCKERPESTVPIEEIEKKKKVASIYKKCNDEVLDDHEFVADIRGWGWGGVVILLGLLWIGIKVFFKKGFSEPGKLRRAMSAARVGIKRVWKAKGNKFKTLINELGKVGRAWTGMTPEVVEINEARAKAVVDEKWSTAMGDLTIAQEAMNEFLDGLDGRIYLMKYDHIRQADLKHIIGETADVSPEQLVERFLRNASQLRTYQDFVRIAGEYLPAMISGQAMYKSDIPLKDRIVAAFSDLVRYSDLMFSLQSANNILRDVIQTVGSAHSVDPAMNADWGRTFESIDAFTRDVQDVLSVQIKKLDNLRKAAGVRTEELRVLYRLNTLAGFISNVLAVHAESAKNNSVKIIFPESVTDIEIGRDKQVPLFKIVNNLIANAIKFAAPSKKRSGDAYVAIEPEVIDGVLRIRIYDNGVGVNNIAQARSGDRERPDLAPGLGLGLVTAYRLAENNGIGIAYRNRSSWIPFVGENGSEFVVTLNLRDERVSPLPSNPLSSGGGLTSMGGGASVTPSMMQSHIDNAITGGVGMLFANNAAITLATMGPAALTPVF